MESFVSLIALCALLAVLFQIIRYAVKWGTLDALRAFRDEGGRLDGAVVPGEAAAAKKAALRHGAAAAAAQSPAEDAADTEQT